MASLFKTLEELLEDVFSNHVDNTKINEISQDVKTLKEDILSIKAFLQIPDVRIGATQDELDALGTKVKAEVDTITTFDNTIPKDA